MSALRLPGQLAVLDVETTGLFPRRHDRVIEVAAVVVGLDGAIEREFVTLVNPERDIGPSSIHGLTSEDIISAPRFREVAGLIVDVLQGTLAIAAHNLRFDRLFLVGEFSRLGCEFPDCFGLCTLELAGGGKLEECCRDRGVGFTGDWPFPWPRTSWRSPCTCLCGSASRRWCTGLRSSRRRPPACS